MIAGKFRGQKEFDKWPAARPASAAHPLPMNTSAVTHLSSAASPPATAVVSKAATAAALVLLLSVPARAATTLVYDNMVPVSTIHNGRENDVNAPNWLHADGMQFASAATFNKLTWHGIRAGNPESFRLRIYPMDGSAPAMNPMIDLSLGLVTRLDSGYRDPYQSVIYAYSAEFGDQTLAAGSYAISIFNDSNDGVPWLWAVGNNRDGSFMILKGETAWRNATGAPEFAFTLSQVPEPGAIGLLAVVVPFVLSCRRRR